MYMQFFGPFYNFMKKDRVRWKHFLMKEKHKGIIILEHYSGSPFRIRNYEIK